MEEDTEMKKEDESIDKDEGNNIDFPQKLNCLNFNQFLLFS